MTARMLAIGRTPANRLSPRLTMISALSCGAVVANIYYAQPLIGLISPALGMNAELAGLVVTLTQLGYGAGLLLLGSLADLVENRRLIVLALLGTAAGLVGVGLSGSAVTFLLASFTVGFFAVATQVLVPFAALLAPEGRLPCLCGAGLGVLALLMFATERRRRAPA
jgi:MFS family permease